MAITNTIQLSTLDEIIRQRLHPSTIELAALNTTIDETVTSIQQEVKGIRAGLLAAIEELTTKESVQLFVSHHATYFSSLCDTLWEYHQDGAGRFSPSMKTLYRDILTRTCKELCTLIDFIRYQYKGYFDQDLTVPFCQVDIEQGRLRRSVTALAPLYKLPGADHIVIDFALSPVRSLVKYGPPISYRQLSYYQRIIKALQQVLNSSDLSDANLAIHHALITINFNQPEYIHYCFKQTHVKYGQLSFMEQLEKYHWYIKLQQQVVSVPDIAFHPEQPSAVVQLNNYLQHEIAYIEKRMILEKGIVNGVPILNTAPRRVPLKLGVDQAAAWWHSLFEADFLQAETKEEAIDLFCDHFATVGANEVSRKSFRSKFFSMSQAAVVYIMEKVNTQKEVMRKYP